MSQGKHYEKDIVQSSIDSKNVSLPGSVMISVENGHLTNVFLRV